MCDFPDKCFVCGKDMSGLQFQARKNHVVWTEGNFTIRHRHNFEGFTPEPSKSKLPDLLTELLKHPDDVSLREECKGEIYALLAQISSKASGAASLRAIEQLSSMIGLAFKEEEHKPDEWLVLHVADKALAGIEESDVIIDELWAREA